MYQRLCISHNWIVDIFEVNGKHPSFIVVIEYLKKCLHHIPRSLFVAAVTSVFWVPVSWVIFALKHLLITHYVQGTGDTIQSNNL